MTNYVVVSVVSGIAFGALDAVINANPLAQRLLAVYRPISRKSLNPVVGVTIDLVFGFVLAGVYLMLYASLPGDTGLAKGLSYGLMVWFFRVVMSIASQWMMFEIPLKTHLYSLTAGLGEMLALGLLYGLALQPLS